MARGVHIARNFAPTPRIVDAVDVVEVSRDELPRVAALTWDALLQQSERAQRKRVAWGPLTRVPAGYAWLRQGDGGLKGRPVLYQQGW